MQAILDELTAILAGWDGRAPDGAGGGRDAAAPERASDPCESGGRATTLCEAAVLADDAAFDELAMRVHAAQRATNPVLRAYWDASPGGEPAAWHEIPPVPAAAFRDMAIVSGKAERVFRTSGTTGGGGRRGEHHVLSIDLYRAAARANYRSHLLQGAESLRILSLIPDPREAADSSLAAMAGFIAAEPGIAGVAWGFHPRDGVNIATVRSAAAPGEPVLVLATAFALAHLLDALDGERVPLPIVTARYEAGQHPESDEAAEPPFPVHFPAPVQCACSPAWLNPSSVKVGWT